MPYRIKTISGYIAKYLYGAKTRYCDFTITQDRSKAHSFTRITDAEKALHRIGVQAQLTLYLELMAPGHSSHPNTMIVEVYFPDIENVMNS